MYWIDSSCYGSSGIQSGRSAPVVLWFSLDSTRAYLLSSAPQNPKTTDRLLTVRLNDLLSIPDHSTSQYQLTESARPLLYIRTDNPMVYTVPGHCMTQTIQSADSESSKSIRAAARISLPPPRHNVSGEPPEKSGPSAQRIPKLLKHWETLGQGLIRTTDHCDHALCTIITACCDPVAALKMMV